MQLLTPISPRLSADISKLFRSAMETPFRFLQTETANIDAAKPEHKGGFIFDLSEGRPYFSDGLNWLTFSLSTHTHAAASVTFAPAGSIAATNVQAALEELDSEKQPKDATLTALAGAAWSAGTQVLTFTAADTVTLKTVGSSSGNILDKAAGDSLYQPKETTLTALAALAATAGLLEQTSADNFAIRLVGVANSTDVPTRADADARYQLQSTFAESVDDRVATLLGSGGTNISVTYDDTANTVTIAVSDAQLNAIASLTPAADQIIYWTGVSGAAMTAFTASARAIAALNLVQGDLIYSDGTGTVAKLAKNTTATRYLSNTGTSNNPAWAQIDISNGVTGRLPLANFVQATATDKLLGRSTAGAGNFEEIACTAAGRALIDDADAAAQRTTLGLGTAAVEAYSTGTFTPGLTFGGGSTGMTFSSQTGRYTKIGRLVVVTVRLILSAKGSSTGSALVTNLPFAANASLPRAIAAVNFSSMAGTNAPQGVLLEGTTTIFLFTHAAGTATLMNDTHFTNLSEVLLTIAYET